MALHCIRELFLTLFASDMADTHQIRPSNVSVGKQVSVEHALSCSHGGFPSIRHNELRDINAKLMSEVCHNVGTDPPLQPVTDEHLIHCTANREDGDRLDVLADSFWGSDRQDAFF